LGFLGVFNFAKSQKPTKWSGFVSGVFRKVVFPQFNSESTLEGVFVGCGIFQI
jgi:hypothetical protein